MMAAGADEQEEQPRYYDEFVQCRICGGLLKNLAWAHLQMHGLTTAEYKKRFNVAYVVSDQLRKKLSDSRSRGHRRDRYEPRSREGILEAMRGYARQSSPLTYHWLKKKAPSLAKQAVYAYGSWRAALKAAGLKPKPLQHRPKAGIIAERQRWSRGLIIARIRRRASEGRSLTTVAVSGEDGALFSAAHRYLGTWERAIEASGFDYGEIRKTKARDRETITRELRAWCLKHGPLKAAALKATDGALYTTVIARFGSVAKAARVLRLPSDIRVQQRWSKERVVAKITRRASAGRPLFEAAIKKEVLSLHAAALRHFGSWGKAIEASGLDYAEIRRPRLRTSETISRDLHAWHRKHGPLNTKALEGSDAPLYQATYKCFGSVEKAANALKLPFYSPFQRWSKNRVVAEIQRRASEGRALNAKAVAEEDSPLYQTACAYFGSWGKTVEASGFDYSQVRMRRARDRETIALDLRAWVRKHGPLNASALRSTDNRLLCAVHRVVGPLEKAARELGLPFHSPRQRWSRDRVIAEIKRRTSQGQTLDATSVTRDDHPLYSRGNAYFGCWEKAVEASGHDYSKIRRRKVRTRETTGRELRAWVSEHGPLNYSALVLTDGALLAAANRLFGHLEKAAGELGLPYRPLRRRVASGQPR